MENSPQAGQLVEACGFALRIDDEPRTDEIQLEPKIREEIEDWLWSFVEEDISEADIPEEDASYHEEMNDSELVNSKWRALAALIHCGWWSENLPASSRRERFYQESNLIVDAQGETNLTARLIDLKSVNQESAFVLGLLFLRSPKVFVSALLELLEDQTEDEYDGRNNTFLSIARLLTGQKKMRDYSPRIDRALCLHAAQQQTNFMARPYWFEALVGYSPDALVHFNWVDYMADWNSLARGGLAQAVAESIPRLSGPEERRKAREMAQILTLDGEFGVRRNAYRALHDLPDERGKSRLEELMNLWSRLGQDQLQVELRQRAAEGAGWLPSLRLLDGLMHDPEKCVRDVARKSLDARRKRDLADLYLNKIIHAARATIIPKNQKNFNEQSSAFVSSQLSPVSLESATSNNGIVLRALPYGEALTHLGEDQHIEALRDFSRNQRLPGHVFY